VFGAWLRHSTLLTGEFFTVALPVPFKPLRGFPMFPPGPVITTGRLDVDSYTTGEREYGEICRSEIAIGGPRGLSIPHT